MIAKEVLANGRLTQRNQENEFIERSGALKEIAKEAGVEMDAIAIAAALLQPWIDLVLSGATQTGQLTSNLSAVGIELNEEQLNRLGRLAETPDYYWKQRKTLTWN